MKKKNAYLTTPICCFRKTVIQTLDCKIIIMYKNYVLQHVIKKSAKTLKDCE